MSEYDWRQEQARKSLNRILPEVETTFADRLQQAPLDWPKFKNRLYREWERLFICLHQLYGWQYDFFYTLERILNMMVQYWLERSAELKLLDEKRESDPYWYLSENVVGGVLYVDLFSDNLAKLDDHISYFKKLGVNYLHLMPLFAVPKGNTKSSRLADTPKGIMTAAMLSATIGPSTRISAPWRNLPDWPPHFEKKGSAWCWISSSTIPPMNMFGLKRPNPTIRILWPITIPFRIANCRINFKSI